MIILRGNNCVYDFRLLWRNRQSYGIYDQHRWEQRVAARRSTRPLVPPGEYQVSLTKVENGEWSSIGNTQSITVRALNNVTIPAENRQALAEFQKDVLELNAKADNAEVKIDQALETIASIKQAAINNAEVKDAYDTAEKLRMSLLNLWEELEGDETKTSRYEYAQPGLKDRIGYAMGSIGRSTSPATESQKQNYQIASRWFEKFSDNLNDILSALDELKQKLKEQAIYMNKNKTES